MALPAIDNLNRANGALGSDWATVIGSITITSNAARPGSSGNESAARWTSDTFGNDQYARCVLAARTADIYMGPAVRMASGAASYYGFYSDSTGSYLFKVIAGTFTQLATGSAVAVGATMEIRASGTAISAYVNGSLFLGPVTDSSLSSGAAGLCGFDTGTGTRADDFEGGNLSTTVALSAALSGAGDLAAALTVSGSSTVDLAAALSGAGDLAATLTVTGSSDVALSAALSGQGDLAASLTVTGTSTVALAAALSGTGELAATLTITAPPAAPVVVVAARPVTAAEYKLIIRGPDGVKRREVGDYDWLAYTKRVNDPGLLRFALRGDHPAITSLEDRGQVEVWRRIPSAGVDWYLEFATLYRDEDQAQAAQHTFEASCPGQLSMLGWRTVAWKANTANRSVFTGIKAATIMWRLADYNAGPNATTGNGRELAGAISGVSVGSDPNSGPVLDWSCAWANLLAELQKLQKLADGDFDLVKTGPATWAWQFFPGQRGTDRSATVVFSVDRGNMTNLRRRETRSAARTVAIVGGPGEEAARRVRVRYGPDYSAGNHIEVFVDARGTNEAAADAALDAQGDRSLEAARSQATLSYDVLQVDSCRYGLHYDVGDLVSYRAFGYTGTQQILAANVEHRGGVEQIRMEQRNV